MVLTVNKLIELKRKFGYSFKCKTVPSISSNYQWIIPFQVFIQGNWTISTMENLCYNEEDEAYAEKIIHQQESFLAKVKIPEWLENAESPYKWLKSLSYKSITFGHGKLYGRVKDIHNQEDYTFEKYGYFYTMCNKMYRNGNQCWINSVNP